MLCQLLFILKSLPMLNMAHEQGRTCPLDIGMTEPVSLMILSGGLFSLYLALAKGGYIYELSPPPYWLATLLADACHITLYTMTYVKAATCSERPPSGMYILF